jgi:hypothetical protein
LRDGRLDVKPELELPLFLAVGNHGLHKLGVRIKVQRDEAQIVLVWLGSYLLHFIGLQILNEDYVPGTVF